MLGWRQIATARHSAHTIASGVVKAPYWAISQWGSVAPPMSGRPGDAASVLCEPIASNLRG